MYFSGQLVDAIRQDVTDDNINNTTRLVLIQMLFELEKLQSQTKYTSAQYENAIGIE